LLGDAVRPKTPMKNFAKKLAHIILGDYSAYHVYARTCQGGAAPQLSTALPFRVAEVDEPAIKLSADALIREQAGYAGTGAHAYACFDGDRIVGLCFYWFGDRYLKRNYWPLAEGEAKLVQIVTLPEIRGRGVATSLIESSLQDMGQKRFTRSYARIWHSNMPSIRAFDRAGWLRIALVIEINPLRRSQSIRMRFNTRAEKG